MINLKIKLINKDAIMPSYANKKDAGMDLFSVEEKELQANESKLIKTGLVIELPEDTEAQIRPRSGLALKYQVTVLNTPGTIDFGYRGEIGVILINHGKKTFIVKKGMRVAQMVIKPTLKVKIMKSEELTDTERGKNGFGSTGEM